MTQQQIKKYRRKVSDELVEHAARAAYATKELWYDYDAYHEIIFPEWNDLSKEGNHVCLEVARAALEADAEVIEFYVDGTWAYYAGGVLYSNLEQFHTEWEEIQC